MHANVFHPERKPKDYFIHARAEMLTFISPSARRILDVGCGAGNFGALVKSHTGEKYGELKFPLKKGPKRAQSLINLLSAILRRVALDCPRVILTALCSMMF